MGNQNIWLSGGQEAIPYQNTEVSTYNALHRQLLIYLEANN